VKARVSRRDALKSGPLWAGAVLVEASCNVEATQRPKLGGFRYCLNTSTLRGQKLTLAEEIEIAAKAGYNAVEPWVNEIENYVKAGGSLKDLGKRIRDHGLTVESAIGFPEWIVDDPERRKAGREEARRNMDLVQQIGGKRLAAPPVGATNQAIALPVVAERYRALLEIGDRMGVVPQAELWGFSKTLGKLSEAAYVAIESGHPKACVLPDVYHLYKGGSDFIGLALLSASAFHVIHMNDYPANPPRSQITDAARVFPGDGIAPWREILGALRSIGYDGVLSLELFNSDYWKQDALEVAKTGLKKMKRWVE
jgi:sugar phosphate isomerase/epimerase